MEVYEMNQQIEFDPTDWDSIRRVAGAIEGVGVMLFGESEYGEDVTFTLPDENTLLVSTLQSNGWIRKNYYHLDEEYTEEMYSKERDDNE